MDHLELSSVDTMVLLGVHTTPHLVQKRLISFGLTRLNHWKGWLHLEVGMQLKPLQGQPWEAEVPCFPMELNIYTVSASIEQTSKGLDPKRLGDGSTWV